MFNLAERNLKIFFRQKGAVFFSLLGVYYPRLICFVLG